MRSAPSRSSGTRAARASQLQWPDGSVWNSLCSIRVPVVAVAIVALALKNYFAVVSQKIRVRLSQLPGEANRFSLKRDKTLFQGWLREEFTEPLAQNDVEAVIERNQASVKGGIVKR